MVNNRSMLNNFKNFLDKKNLQKLMKFNTSVTSIDNYLLHLCMLVQSIKKNISLNLTLNKYK